jgi:hypothetical protein
MPIDETLARQPAVAAVRSVVLWLATKNEMSDIGNRSLLEEPASPEIAHLSVLPSAAYVSKEIFGAGDCLLL